MNSRTVHNGNPDHTVNSATVHDSVNPRAVHNALSSRAVAGALRNTAALHNPHTRALIAASAATAGWAHGHGENGWWRHRNGGFGWVGPLFWPFAYYDIYDYALWGYGYDPSFWGYGYDDIYAGMFAPYGYRALTGYQRYAGRSPSASRSGPAVTPNATLGGPLAQMCGEDSRDIAGLPVDQFQRAIQPDAAQSAALDELANASVKAAQDIKAACPTEIALTAPSRLAAMQKRIEAMIGAVATVQPPLEKFYGLLSDEQKERITALGQEQRRGRNAGSPESCSAAPSMADWPAADIERAVRPTEAQRASLTALQDATAKAADMLKVACPGDDALTPPARLAAVGTRLDTLLQAVKTVIAPLNDFYGALDDEQKARFNAISAPQTSAAQTGQSDHSRGRQASFHRHGFFGVGSLIRHMLRFF
ncbi:MAG TPA: Spy/CpxP family protein refolding chaperone [Xanthobacteraceae bacterium]